MPTDNETLAARTAALVEADRAALARTPEPVRVSSEEMRRRRDAALEAVRLARAAQVQRATELLTVTPQEWRDVLDAQDEWERAAARCGVPADPADWDAGVTDTWGT
jgi:hypothetical protein